MSQASVAQWLGAQDPGLVAGTARLTSLDVFRGATIAFMVLVNTAGDGHNVYGPLRHAEWNGWTPTDVVFPSFLWIVGVAMTLSLGKRLSAGISRGHLMLQAFRRAAILYALGFFIYLFPHFDFSTARVLGVLQRIAICYAICAVIFLTTGLRGQIAWIVGLLGSYWLIMAFAPVPGYGAGHLDVERNFAHYVDRIWLGAHNYAATKTWDPEGIVSTLPAIATTLFGIMAGRLLRLKRDLAERCVWLFLAGNLLIMAGLICNVWLPINKKLWTSSFSLFMAGLDFVIFAAVLWWVDGQGHKRFTRPFVILGMNAIAIYMASELIDEVLGATGLRGSLYRNIFAPLASPINASLLYALAYVGLMFAIAYIMYRRRWFMRV
jgi:predicted acyltransferase